VERFPGEVNHKFAVNFIVNLTRYDNFLDGIINAAVTERFKTPKVSR
jgi:hypothetical protein